MTEAAAAPNCLAGVRVLDRGEHVCQDLVFQKA